MAAFNGLKRAFNGLKRALDFTKGSEELPPAKVLCQRDLDCDSMASCSSSFPISSSISSTSQWKYDVFLSFRGEDTRNTAVDIVNNALQWRGIYAFKDDEKLEKGKTIKPELFKAIEESRFAVVILSKNYASSTWCLDELVKIIDCEKEKGLTILPIFYDVDPSDLRKLKGAFAKAFDEHEKQFKEKVGTWRAALNHVADIVGYHIKNSSLSEAVKSIVRLVSYKSCPEFSEITEGLVGIHSRLAELESCLALWLKDDVRSIGIWAMGGMGKSTLAKVAYEMISKEFDYCCFINGDRKKDLFSVQEYLISQILHGKDSNIQNELNGEHMIKKMLRDKKVLLVLDDVDESNKLRKVVKSGWFGSGSRIIITTRDKHLLKELSVDEIFEVKALNYKDAHCLFCSMAFKKEQCPDEYLELIESFLEYVNGLPLALEVLGSFLIDKSTDEWKSELTMLKDDPDPGIGRVLKISFDRLHDSVKDIFKDIACFFNHEKEDHVVQMLDSIGHHSKIGLSILIDKSLLKISNNELWMHNLLRDMGRDIVRQESRDEPGKRSRLWLYEDIDAVLENNTGTIKVQAMDIRGVEACWRGFTFSKKQKRPDWNPNAFLKMSSLKFLRVRNVLPQHVPIRLPNSLRYLDWSGYPAKSFPFFQPNKLVQLHLPHSKIEFLWEGLKNIDELKSINMAGSSNLIKAPNFDGVPKLEELVLEGCSKLRMLDPSIGKLENLKLLNLKKCQELTSLPKKFESKSLVTLDLTGCSKVKKIPEFAENMKHLLRLLLEGTAITELPSSVECLTGLNTLILKNCKNFVCLPNIICSLTSLNNLILFGCPKFDKLPQDLGNIRSLEKLDLCGTAIKELPSSIEFLISLEVLALEDCKKFVLLPSTVTSLKSLTEMHLSRCPKFVNLPENLGNFKHLRRLCFEGTAIKVLPSSVGGLAALYYLNLKDCKNLVCLPSTICNLKRVSYLNLGGCSKITNLPENLGNMERLSSFTLGGTAIKELPSSAIHLGRALSWLSFKGCQLSSSSLTSMPSGSAFIDLSNCNLSAIPSGVDRAFRIADYRLFFLYLDGNDFVSLPESISQFSGLRSLYLDGCKSLRSLSNIQLPSRVEFICVDNCTSLEGLPEGPEPPNDSDQCFWDRVTADFTVQCFNCVKLAENFENFSNMFQGQSSQKFEICCIVPGREIPKWFEKVNICGTSVYTDTMMCQTWKTKKVKIQLPGSDEWRGIVLCVVFLPPERHHGFQLDHRYDYRGVSYNRDQVPQIRVLLANHYWCYTTPNISSEYGEVESHHLWLHSLSKNKFGLPKTPGLSIDKKGFHQVELEIQTQRLEVEKIGFRVVKKQKTLKIPIEM